MENISNQTLPRTSAKFEYSIKRRISKFLSLHSSNESTQSQSNLIHGQILENSYQELFQTESSKRCPHVNEKSSAPNKMPAAGILKNASSAAILKHYWKLKSIMIHVDSVDPINIHAI